MGIVSGMNEVYLFDNANSISFAALYQQDLLFFKHCQLVFVLVVLQVLRLSLLVKMFNQHVNTSKCLFAIVIIFQQSLRFCDEFYHF
jgi:hypothetical protein